ncbi:MAG: helix-turn-helix domain-containing protein [Deltaproteobacteria bacterium]|nr:helix-turn-helix domain-containing protein [Deltaproteobacteria bacterium]
MYSIRQAADLIGVQPKVIRRLLGEGRLPGAVRVEAKHGGHTWRISPEALETLRGFSRDDGEQLVEVQAPTAVSPPAACAAHGQPVQPAAVPSGLTEAEIVARHLAPAAAVLNGGSAQTPKDHLVPMSVVVELLRSEADQRRQAQRMAEDQANTVALLRQSIEIDRDEILRLRAEITEIRQELQQAQRGLLRLQSKPMPTVDHERVTMPLDAETLQRIAAMN